MPLMPSALSRVRRVYPLMLTLAMLPACAGEDGPAAPVARVAVELDRSAVTAGSALKMDYRFTVPERAPSPGDAQVFVHFLSDVGETLFTDDHVPPVAPRTWRGGDVVEYSRTVIVPESAALGPVQVRVGLYDPATGARAPLLGGEDVGLRAYRVGAFELGPQQSATRVIFGDGWHDPEPGDGRPGSAWHWSTREGTLTVRALPEGGTLYLDAEQPPAFPAQQVEVRHGGMVVGRVEVTPGRRQVLDIPLAADLAGNGEPGETIDLQLGVAPTVVPADLPALDSPDRRELGLRVFRAAVEPKQEE
ncbi:MAG: hypothetical protein AB7G23_04265 [Vicinamibacterales bacterium]